MTRRTVRAVVAIALLGATALTTTDAFALQPTARATTGLKATSRASVVKTTPRYVSRVTPAPRYTSPRTFHPPKIDPKGGSGVLNKLADAAKAVTNAATSDKPTGFSEQARKVLKTLPGQQQDASKPGPLTTPAPKPGDKLADKVHPQNKDPGTPGNPGNNNWPSKNWPSGRWPSAPDGPVVSEPAPVVVQQPSVSMPDRAVAERPVTVMQRAVDDGAPACGMPALAAGIDALLPTARLSETDLAMVKAMRAAMIDLAAAGNEAGARELEAKAMSIFGYEKVWLRCGQGAFAWEKLSMPG
jgi:hypothetical protein